MNSKKQCICINLWVLKIWIILTMYVVWENICMGPSKLQELGTNDLKIMYILLDSLKASQTTLFSSTGKIHTCHIFFFMWTKLFSPPPLMIFTSLSYHDSTMNLLWKTWDHWVIFWILQLLGMTVAFSCLKKKYVDEILERAGMSSCKPWPTPVDTKLKLSIKVGTPYEDTSLYCSLDGALQYLTFTRSGIL